MRVEQLALNHMYKIANNTAPLYLCNEFLKTADCHGHNTRNSENSFSIPKVKSNGINSFKFQAAKIWNDIPNTIKSAKSITIFKPLAKKYLSNKIIGLDKQAYVYY